MRGASKTFIVGAGAAAIAAGAQASILRFSSVLGNEGLGSYNGEFNWTAPAANDGGDGDGCGTLVLTLVNTSAPSNGGSITGFAFNVVDGIAASFVPDAKTLPGWQQVVNADANPYGVFDIGAALGGDWLGGGSPNGGVPVGQSWQFTFSLCGDEEFLRSLAIEEIFHATTSNHGSFEFIARFRGFADGGSDKVPANLPAPGALALLALGGMRGRRR
jgi:hypothetical protein